MKISSLLAFQLDENVKLPQFLTNPLIQKRKHFKKGVTDILPKTIIDLFKRSAIFTGTKDRRNLCRNVQVLFPQTFAVNSAENMLRKPTLYFEISKLNFIGIQGLSQKNFILVFVCCCFSR